MKKLLTAHIGTGVGMLPTKYTLDHLQEAHQETADALALALGISSSGFTVLYGCVNSTVAPIYTVTAGAIYSGGEIYLVDAFTFTSGGSDVAVGTITETYIAQDPMIYTDQSLVNTHAIRKIVFASATSGTGSIDFSALKRNGQWQTYDLTGHMTPTGTTISVVNGARIRFVRDGNKVHFNLVINITTAAATLQNLALDLSAILVCPNVGFYGYYGSVFIDGDFLMKPAFINGNTSLMNITDLTNHLSTTTSTIIYANGVIEVVPQ